MSWFTFSWPSFLFSFLGLAFEGLPFVLFGSLISGFIAAFVPSPVITRLLPKNPFLATLASGLLGIVFPVCECGIVPIIRRLINKGLPASCGITFMLASPIVNPIVAFSTFAAFRGQDPWMVMGTRLILGYFVAVVVGLVLQRTRPEAILREGAVSIPGRKRLAFSVSPLPDAANGASVLQKIVAATFNTAVNQAIIQPLAANTTLSTFSMMAISVILTLCSTSDAFIAATFVTFSMVARIAFMVFGPMFDLKLFFLYSVLFKKRFVLSLGIGLFVFVGLICSRILPFFYANQGF